MNSAYPRIRRIVVAALVGGGFVLGLLPPALGTEPPETVLRSERVAIPAPADASVGVTRLAGAAVAEEDVWTEEAEVCADIRFTAVGLTWQQDGEGQVRLRLAWGNGKRFSEPINLLSDPDHSPDPDAPDTGGRFGTPPVWTGEARCIRFQMQLPEGEEIRDLRAEFLNTMGTAGAGGILGALTDGMAKLWGMAASDPAAAIPPRPAIITRSAWGADESMRRCGPSYADRLKMAYVHHTASGNTYTREQAAGVVRAIYAYHTRSQGWCDVAYNFLVDRFGRIYEGRFGGMTRPVIGGHAMGFNTGSTGVALIGDHTTRDPSAAALKGLRQVLAWRLDVSHLNPRGTAVMVSGGGSNTRYPAGREVRLPVISGHRETGYTTCPGDRLWNRLPSIRQAVQNLGLPKIWNPRQSRGAIDIGQTSVRYRAALSGTLAWRVQLRTPDDTVVRSWSGTGSSVDVTWDGTDALGVPMEDGAYRAVISATDGPDGPRARNAVLRTTVSLGCTQRAQPGVPLHGGDGGEVLCGTSGNDVIVGGSGNDIIVGFGGNDLLQGGAGNDVIVAGPGNNTLEGGAGNDTLIGGPGTNLLRGQGGDDLLIPGPGNATVQGGVGNDTVSYQQAPRGVTVDLAAGTGRGWGQDSLAGIQNVIGSRFGDVIRGSEAANLLQGRGGNDLLEGRAGENVLMGGPGKDRLVAGPGDERLLGGGGIDTVSYARSPVGVTVDLAAGTATGAGQDRLNGIRNVLGSRFADRLFGDGRPNRLAGRGGNDLLVGRGGDDVLIGGPGRNVLRGGPGNDILRARNGNPDVVRGGPGRDVAFVDRGLDDVRGVQQIR